jgi:hypothetical protein
VLPNKLLFAVLLVESGIEHLERRWMPDEAGFCNVRALSAASPLAVRADYWELADLVTSESA